MALPFLLFGITSPVTIEIPSKGARPVRIPIQPISPKLAPRPPWVPKVTALELSGTSLTTAFATADIAVLRGAMAPLGLLLALEGNVALGSLEASANAALLRPLSGATSVTGTAAAPAAASLMPNEAEELWALEVLELLELGDG